MRTCPTCGFDNRLHATRCYKCGSASRPLPEKRALSKGYFLGKTFRFDLQTRIAKGRNSELWLAHDLKFRRSVIALKVVKPAISRQKGAEAALRRVSLHVIPHAHPNLARIHSFETDEKFAFFVVEYIKGPALSDVLKRRKKFTQDEVLWVIREVCTGLRYLHKLRLCHGDLKVSNLMLNQAPPEDRLPTIPMSRSHPHQCIKVCDEIISRVLEDLRQKKRRISPGQWKIKDDAFCLAKILYRLYKGRKMPQKPEMKKIASSLPPRLAQVFDFCAKSPDRTHRNMADILIEVIEKGYA